MDRAALSKYKAELGMRAAMRSAHDSPDQGKAKAIEDIPVRKMYEQAMYIENELLPRIEKKGGTKSADYQFFREVYKSILWAIIVLDRFDKITRLEAQTALYNELLRDRVLLLEKELQKYITMEDLLFSDGIDRIADVIKNRAADLL